MTQHEAREILQTLYDRLKGLDNDVADDNCLCVGILSRQASTVYLEVEKIIESFSR